MKNFFERMDLPLGLLADHQGGFLYIDFCPEE